MSKLKHTMYELPSSKYFPTRDWSVCSSAAHLFDLVERLKLFGFSGLIMNEKELIGKQQPLEVLIRIPINQKLVNFI